MIKLISEDINFSRKYKKINTLFSDYFKVQHGKVSTSKKSCVFTLAHVQYLNLPFSFQGLALVAINI